MVLLSILVKDHNLYTIGTLPTQNSSKDAIVLGIEVYILLQYFHQII